MRGPWKLSLAGCLGVGCSMLVACGTTGGADLIPASNAGPLKDDFQAVATAVANGDCQGATSLVDKARADLTALPASVSADLTQHLKEGIDNLARLAPVQCAKQAATSSTATTAATDTSATDTSTTTTPTDTTTSPTTSTTTTSSTTTTDTTTTNTTPGGNGGTQAPPGAGSGGAGAPGGSGDGGANGNGNGHD